MFIGAMLPSAFVAWGLRRWMRPAERQSSRLPVQPPRPAWPNADALPRNVLAVAPETQAVLTAAHDFARSRCVELQMAVEPGLSAKTDAAEFRSCLRHLLLGAIGRASSGVLVTAMQQANVVEIAVLDDGAATADARPDCSAQLGGEAAVPQGGALTTHYQPERGTTILLRLPQPDWTPVPSDADAFDGIAAFARL